MLEKISTCQNNPNESSITEINKHTPLCYSLFTHCSFDKSKNKLTEINKHTPLCYSLFTHCSFDKSKNKLDHYRGKDCMKKFCKDLREHATKIINCEKKKMTPLTTKEKIYHNDQEICYICKEEFDKNNKKYYKVRDHCHYTGKYRGAAYNICNLRY